MTHVEYGGGGSTQSTGTVAADPGILNEASHQVKTGNQASDDIKAAVLITLNGLMESLGTLSYIQGAINLADAISDFSSNIELSMGCVAVDMAVVSSGLQVAAEAFASVDKALASTFATLESQLPYFTTDTTLTSATVATYTPLQTISPSNGSNPFSHVWHDVKNWGSDIYQNTTHGLESVHIPVIGHIPVVGAVIIGGVVVGLYYTVAAIGGTAAVAAAG